MKAIPPSIQKVIREFNKLPGIGHKSSERFVYYLLRQNRSEIEALAQRLQELKTAIQLCQQCYTYAESPTCTICADRTRTANLLCVVAEPKDVIAIEKTNEFKGVYHVLGGVINHIEGVGPQHLRIPELLQRIDASNSEDATTIEEVIIATNPDMEGETTAILLSNELKGKPVRLTRIARGLPVGADIEFADEVTLGNALSARHAYNRT